MRPSTIFYLLRQGFKNIRRNWMFSLASVMTMAACIFLFGIFYSIVNNVTEIARRVEEEVPIQVFFEEGTTGDQMKEIGKLIEARPEVARLEFESGDQAWEEFKEKYFGDSEAAEGFRDDNPLINSSNYRIYMNEISSQGALVAYVKSLEHVREVKQSEEAARTLGSFNQLLSWISIAVIVILLFISVFLISNTVSVGIAVRGEEISIMKYIGATDAFVRAPFVLEGVILGLFGAAIPLTALYFVYRNTISYILGRFNVLAGSVDFIPVQQIFATLVPISLVLGIGIGLVGSFTTTKKHLKV